jgi:NTE family protein
MVRSTTALFDINAAKALLDRPTTRAVLGRFGATIRASDSSDLERPAAELAGPAVPPGST